MSLSTAQRGVAVGAGAAFFTSLVAMAAAAAFLPEFPGQGGDDRLMLAAVSALAPSLMLAVCIGRLAQHRFFSPEDIDGSALTEGTARARLLQALLQNTLEQAVLAVPVYFAWSLLAADVLLPLLPVSALLFLTGRLFFFRGYAGGAPARAFGFALTFYPTFLLLAGLILMCLLRVSG